MYQENNEMSGSRGEANFVWKCKNCKRESSASIIAAPTAYEQTEPAKKQKIIQFDCRGLEFVEFNPEVGSLCPVSFVVSKAQVTDMRCAGRLACRGC